MSFATIAGQDHIQQRCAEPHLTKQMEIQYASTVVVLITVRVSVVANLMTTERNQGLHPGTLGNKDPEIKYNRMGHQPQVSCHQARINEGLNRQYSPNYINPYQSMLGSAPGQDLSTTLIELGNIQSRLMEMMAASQRSQHEAFQELARVVRKRINLTILCLQQSKLSTVQIGKPSKIGSTKSTRHAEPVIEDSGWNYLKNQLEL